MRNFINEVLPEIYKLLKLNKVKDAEKLILGEIDKYIAVSRDSKPEFH